MNIEFINCRKKWCLILICLIFKSAAVPMSDLKEPLMILTNSLGIKSFNVSTSQTHTLYSNGHHIFDVDVLWHPERPQLFWSDYENGSVYGAVITESGLEAIHIIASRGIAAVEGIAVDWIAQNLYWVESQYGWIEMISLKNEWRTAVVTNIEKPRAIALDSRDGWLFWTTWDRKNSKIERSSMTGRDRATVVDISKLPNGGFPNGITIDYTSRRIYWIDAKSDSVYSTDYFGQYHEIHLDSHRSIQRPFDLVFHNNNLFWVDAELNTFNRINVQNSSSFKVLYETYHSLYGVALLAPDYYPRALKNPCENNFGCSHLCALDVGGNAVCMCPYLMVLNEDEKTCSELESILLVSEFHQEGSDGFDLIFGLSVNSSTHPITLPILPPSRNKIVGLELDALGNYVYWADGNTNAIWRASILDSVVEKVFSAGFNQVTGFGADWYNNAIFYSVVGLQPGIYSCSVVDNSCRVVLETTSAPYSLKLHTKENKLFWLEMFNNSTQVIYSAFLNGTNVVTVYKIDDTVTGMIGFTVDPEDGALYWISSETNSIMKLLSHGEIKSFSSSFTSSNASAIIVEGENLIIGDEVGQIYAVNKLTGLHVTDLYNCSGAISMLKQTKLLKLSQEFSKPPCHIRNEGCEEQHRLQNITATTTTVVNSSCPLICHNSGICTSNFVGEKYCLCAKGYHGSNCQFHTCDGYCEHGRCLVDEDNQPFCFCDLGYFGERCQHSLCQMFCVNGECQLNHGDFVCSCFEGWFGPMCQQQSEDIKNAKTISDICQLYCLNDGDCISSDNDFDLPTCRCRSGYFGVRCESELSEIVFRVMALTFVVVIGVLIGTNVYYCVISRKCNTPHLNSHLPGMKKFQKSGFRKINENDDVLHPDNVTTACCSSSPLFTPPQHHAPLSKLSNLMVCYVKRKDDCDILLSTVEDPESNLDNGSNVLVV